MRQVIMTLLLMITVGVGGYAAGRNAQTPHVVNIVQMGEPHVVLAGRGTRQQKEAHQQSEGCPVVPNGDLSRQKTDDQDITMKGLVF